MKFSLFLLAAGICSFSAAQAQTTPAQPAQRSAATLTPSSAAPAINPNSAANTRSNLPAAGLPDAIDATPLPSKEERAMKGKKHSGSMSSGKGKMKAKM